MLVKNTARRLISVNTAHSVKRAKLTDSETGEITEGKVIGSKPGERYDLKPASVAVNIPDETCKENSKYLYALLKNRDVEFDKSELDELTGADTTTKDSYSSMNKNELLEVAKALDIEADDKMTKSQITALIEENE